MNFASQTDQPAITERDHREPTRRALDAFAYSRTLLGRRGEFRVNWSSKTERPIREITMRALERKGYVQIGASGKRLGFKTARLTRAGEFFQEQFLRRAER